MSARIDTMVPWLGQEEADAASDAIASGWIARGPRVAEFEAAFALEMEIAYAVAANSGTTALHLALIVAGVGPGDEVIVPSYGFIGAANAVRYVGASVVFADVDPLTGTLTVDHLERAITSATRAVIVADQAGVPADIVPIRALVDPLGIVVVEDATSAVGATYRNRPVGAGADITVWSFHPDMLLTTGEGGMLTTPRADWAARARRLREHAISVTAQERYAAVPPAVEEYTELGFDYRLTDLQAAIGLVQLDRLARVVRRRRELAARYRAAIHDTVDLRAVADPGYGTGNLQSFWIEVQDGYPVDREGLLTALAEAGIAARRGTVALHRQPPYRQLAPEGSLPNTERLADRTVVVPLHHLLSAPDQDRVIDVLLKPRIEALG